MGRDQGGVRRAFGRLFRERQIYHRSDGVVRFVKLSTRTQLAMAGVLGLALLWVAYSSVNVVFKEQIIVAKDEQRRDEEAAYRARLQNAETAYDEITALNDIYEKEFEATISALRSQHEALRSLVENKSQIDRRLDALASTLSEAGAPGGRRPEGTNRLMIDPVGREPTPRQSRKTALRTNALESMVRRPLVPGFDDTDVLGNMRTETAELSARQVMLMASLEEEMRHRTREITSVLQHTGIDPDAYLPPLTVARAENGPLGEDSVTTGAPQDFSRQGGPFIPAGTAAISSTYFQSAARVDIILADMVRLNTALEKLPISSPLTDRHYISSRFGMRWDPVVKNRRSPHRGLDFAGRRNAPIVATGNGVVSFAGTRGTFGRTVEIDHGNGFKSRYAHLSRILVRAGQEVKMHDQIGRQGNTGRSTGEHLHYEILYNGRQVDPMKFIEAGRYVFES